MAGIGVVESGQAAEVGRVEEVQGASSSDKNPEARESGASALPSTQRDFGPNPGEPHSIPQAVVGSSAACSAAGVRADQDGVVIPVDVHESGIVHAVVVPPEAASFQFPEDSPGRSSHALIPSSSGVDEEEDVIRIDDDEIEMAGPQGFESATVPKRLFETDRLSSVPPLRPSLRAAKLSGRTTLPPPRRSRLPAPSTITPPSSRIGVEASAPSWLEANHRLVMARTLARNDALEAQLRSRSRDLQDVEGRLGRALRRVAILEAELTAARLQLQTARAQDLSDEGPNEKQIRVASQGQGVNPAPLGSSQNPTAAERSSINPDACLGSVDDPPSGAVHERGELRAIEGIGPKLEAGLHRVGITRLAQIAAWSDADVRRFAKRMKISRSRIVKGQWVERASEAVRRASQRKS